ncbi:MAG TPA: branched-chain amino acid ABC transporter permease [Caldithrix abyssi]|uniref:Branched-chain amino acid ABC transporter permease n=1 Tax=Caldithrix abyssi TaxID=187145 RepID=A0A7V5UFW9_CALAY|nr:branched-chain amino acid ABC transporter permease [Caldithrix abyssi]
MTDKQLKENNALVTKKEWITFIVALLVPLAFIESPYVQNLLIFVLIWAMLGSSWNLLAGYTGLVSFGHAAYFGIGAYAGGLLLFHFKISPWWGLLLGGPAAVILGYLLGIMVFRLRGPYFALGTLASAEILRIIFGEEEWLTNGHNGILYITTWVTKLPYYYIGLVLAILCIISIKAVMRSKAGYYFLSIREDEDAAQALGIDTKRYKNISTAISTFWAGTAGAFYMIYMGFIDPEVVFALHDISIVTILVGIIGGVGTIWGPALGALVMVFLQEFFRSSIFGLAPDWVSRLHALAFGLLVIFVILYMAGGIVGDWDIIQRKLGFLKKTETES